MIATTTRLRTGDELVIKMLEPPLGEYADLVGCWASVREHVLGGRFKPWLFTPYFVGEIEGRVVGSMSYYTPTDTRDVGVTEFVETAEAHRQKGVASALLAAMHKRFIGDGGLALYLCTSNPIAGKLYERHGYWYGVGDGMRYLRPGAEEFDETYLAFCGTAGVRDAHWGDLPRASALFNHPEPGWLLKDYLTQSFRETRYEQHFVRLMRRVENRRGAFLVLENPLGRMVGAAALERVDTFYEQHVAFIGFRVSPSYMGQAVERLGAGARRAADLGVRCLQTYVAGCDEDQEALVKEAGYSLEARLRDRLRDGDRWVDMLVYSQTLPVSGTPVREKGDYYGGRKPWQAQRVAESGAPTCRG